MSVTWNTGTENVYTEVSGTFTFNDDDVNWLYVDWDDGIDNSIDNAIYEWQAANTASKSMTLTHTYTKHGSFYPVVRTVNSDGFLSKYFYSGGNVTNLPEPNEQIQTITPITITDINPLGDLKVENKQFLSGIDTNIFGEGPKDVYIQVAPTVASGTSTDLTGKSLKLEVKCVEAVYNNTSYADLGYERNLITVNKTFTLDDRNGIQDAIKLTSKKIADILEVKLVTAKLTGNPTDNLVNEFNGLKIFLIAQSTDTNWYPITYITNGDPIKSKSNIKRKVKLDFTQSRTSASNAALSYYSYDSGKVFWEPKEQWQASSSTILTDATEIPTSFYDSSYTYYARPDGLKGSNYLNTVSNSTAFYSGNSWLYDTSGKTDFVRNQFLINEFNQFYDQYHLARMQTTTDTDKTNAMQTFKAVYRIRPPALSIGDSAFYFNETTGTQDLTTNAHYNTSAYPVSTSSWADVSFVDSDGNPRDASSYFILGLEEKYGKVFFNNSTFAADFMSNLSSMQGQKIEGVYYLKLSNEIRGDKFTQKAEWIPLEFEDTTRVEKTYRNTSSETYEDKSTAFAKSGYISYDIPSDWSKTSIQDLTGGFFNTSGSTEASLNVTTDYSIPLESLARGASNITNGPFPTVKYTDATVGTNLAKYTDEQIGGFKYVFHCSGGGSSTDNKVLWVASSSIADDAIYLVSGNTPAASMPVNMNGFLRRVNVYDVFDGVSKTSNTGAVPNFVQLPTSGYSYNFMFGGDAAAADADLNPDTVSGSFQNVYPLKIVVSGNTFDKDVATTVKPNQEIWNILPVASSSAQILVQKDNTAYDLTYLPITSNVSVTFAGTYYQAMTKGGTAYIMRTGTPIQTITLSSKAMGDEQSFSWSADYSSFGALEKIRDAQAKGIRVFWDEQQKDATWVRYFGFISGVNETHSNKGKRAPRDFNATLIVEEIVLMNADGELISDVTPLGGVSDARNFS